MVVALDRALGVNPLGGWLDADGRRLRRGDWEVRCGPEWTEGVFPTEFRGAPSFVCDNQRGIYPQVTLQPIRRGDVWTVCVTPGGRIPESFAAESFDDALDACMLLAEADFSPSEEADGRSLRPKASVTGALDLVRRIRAHFNRRRRSYGWWM